MVKLVVMKGCCRCSWCHNSVAPEDGAGEEDLDPMQLRLRECRETPFLIGYVLVAATLISIAWYCFQNCHASYFVRGTDSWGNICGGHPNILPDVEGLKEFAQLKVEATKVWRQVCGDETIRICVKECPILPLNSSSCNEILENNVYESNAVARKFCKEKCFSNEQGHAVVLIVNRCMRGTELNSGYVFIKDYVNLLHYVINDVTSTLVAGGSLFALVLVGSILANVFAIRYPKYASIGCYAGSLTTTALFCVFTTVSLLSIAFDVPAEFKRVNYDVTRVVVTSYITVYSLITLISYASLIYITCCLILTKRDFRKARGLWLSTSKCLSANPKILSQPLLTLFTCTGATFFLLMLTFSIFGCQIIKSSPTNDIAVFEDKSMPWLMLPAMLCYVWFVRLVGKGQSAVLSGASADWYFTKRDHPVTASLRALLKYNLGSFVAVSFSGKLIESFLRILIRKWTNSTILSYFSSQVPIGIGVYGEVREFCLEEKDCDEFEPVFRGYKLVQRSLFSWKIAFTEISTFIFLISTSKTRIFIPIVPVTINALVTWQVCGVFTACMEETMAGIAVCIYEDFRRNNGKRRPYFCPRKVAHLIFGTILPLKSTHYGRERMANQEKRNEIMNEKFFALKNQIKPTHDFTNNESKRAEESQRSSVSSRSSTRSHVSNTSLLSSRSSLRSQVNVSKMQLARSAIMKQTSMHQSRLQVQKASDDRIASYISSQELNPNESGHTQSQKVRTHAAHSPAIQNGQNGSVRSLTIRKTTSNVSSTRSSNESEEIKYHTDGVNLAPTPTIQNSRVSGLAMRNTTSNIPHAHKSNQSDETGPGQRNDSKSSIQERRHPSLVTFTDTRGKSGWEKMAFPVAKILPSSKQGRKRVIKIIKTIKNEEDTDDEWDGWW